MPKKFWKKVEKAITKVPKETFKAVNNIIGATKALEHIEKGEAYNVKHVIMNTCQKMTLMQQLSIV